MSTHSLFRQRFFFFFFWTQALGAFNDNVFRYALGVLIAYHLANTSQADILIQISAGVFILPFFLFSGIAGQVCDKLEKSRLIRWIKAFEILIMVLAAFAFLYRSIYSLMGLLFLIGLRSTVFGPVKYSILPQRLTHNDNLVAGNAWVSMGTFVSIILGTILGGGLVSPPILDNYGTWPIAIAIVAFALIGWATSLGIDSTPAADPSLKISWNPWTETWRTIRIGAKNQNVFFSILGISWFWYFGFFYLASLLSYCRDILHGDASVATLLLAMMSVGIGMGSMLCSVLSKERIEMGLSGIGILGLSLFAFLFVGMGDWPKPETDYHSLATFLHYTPSYFLLFFLLMIGVCGGLFIVPLYARMQHESTPEHRSRIVAANNIWNAIFMTLAAASSAALLHFGISIKTLFLIVGILNLVIALPLCIWLGDYLLSSINRMVVRLIYRIEIVGQDNLPENEGHILASNHVSFIDPLLVSFASRQPPRFMMDKPYYDIIWMRWIFMLGRCIPVVPKKEDPILLEKALDRVAVVLKAGDTFALFPEGFISRDGQMIPFKTGIERIVKQTPVPVVPIALIGAWGSWFSRHKGRAMKGMPWGDFRRHIQIRIGVPLRPDELSAPRLQSEIQKLKRNDL